MVTIISRIVRYGFNNFVRNGLLSVATIVVMVMASCVFASLILFGVVTRQAISSVEDKIDISVYFKQEASEDDILSIKQSLESLPEVKGVDYVSKDRALELFRDRHKDDATISQAINELNVNPLQAALNIKAQDPSQYATIAKYFSSSPNLNHFVDSVSYYENQVVIDRLNTIIRTVDRVGLLLTVILGVIASLMIFATIWLAIFSNREEIAIMRLVGASNSLVRGPYIVQGILAGSIAALGSLIIMIPLVYYASPQLERFVSGLNLFNYFYTHLFALLGYQLLFGIFLGSVSSILAVRRYLKI